MGICGSSISAGDAQTQHDDGVEQPSPRANQVVPSIESQAIAASQRHAPIKSKSTSGDAVTPREPEQSKVDSKVVSSPDMYPKMGKEPANQGRGEEQKGQPAKTTARIKTPHASMSTRSLMIEAAARQSGQGSKTLLYRCHRGNGMGRVSAESKSVTEVNARKSADDGAAGADDGEDIAAQMLLNLQAAMKARKAGQEEATIEASGVKTPNSSQERAVIVTAEKILLEDEPEGRKHESYAGMVDAGEPGPGGASGGESTGVRMYLLHTFEPATQQTRALLATNAPGSTPTEQQLRQLAAAVRSQGEGGQPSGDRDADDSGRLHPGDVQGEAGSVSTLTVSLRGIVPASLLLPEAEHLLVRHLCDLRVGYAEEVLAQDGGNKAVQEAAQAAADVGRGALAIAPVIARGVSEDGGFIIEGRCEGSSVTFRLLHRVDAAQGDDSRPQCQAMIMSVEDMVSALVESGSGTGSTSIDTWAETRLLPLIVRATERIRASTPAAGGTGGLELTFQPRPSKSSALEREQLVHGDHMTMSKTSTGEGSDAASALATPPDPADDPEAPQPIGHVMMRSSRDAPLGIKVACSKSLLQDVALAGTANQAAIEVALGRALSADQASALRGSAEARMGGHKQQSGGGNVLKITAQRGSLDGSDSGADEFRLYIIISFDPSTGAERRLILSADPQLSSQGGADAAHGFISLRGEMPAQLLDPNREQELLRLICELCVCQTSALHDWSIHRPGSIGAAAKSSGPPVDPGRLALCPLVAHAHAQGDAGGGKSDFVLQAVATADSVELRPLARLSRGDEGEVNAVTLVPDGMRVVPAMVALEDVHAKVGTGKSAASEHGGGMGLAMVDVLVRACGRTAISWEGDSVTAIWDSGSSSGST